MQIAAELPAATNWNFDIHWYPRIPGVVSASSFDGKIGLYNMEVSISVIIQMACEVPTSHPICIFNAWKHWLRIKESFLCVCLYLCLWLSILVYNGRVNICIHVYFGEKIWSGMCQNFGIHMTIVFDIIKYLMGNI